jgi:hypothetical protein
MSYVFARVLGKFNILGCSLLDSLQVDTKQNAECIKREQNMEDFSINSRHRSVVVAMAYGLDGRGSTSGRSKEFSSPQQLALGPTQPPIQWAPEATSSGVKRLGREADHSSPSSAQVKNVGAIPHLPYTSSWHGA